VNDEGHKALRAPFPPEQIGKLPKGGAMLDFVGHADVTNRLLEVDPEWTWEPLGRTEDGLPALDRFGNLWIKLTVCGTTRIGVGDGKSAKELISDALRNAAMRFGVALDLWAKGDRDFGIEGHDAPARHQVVGGQNDRQAPDPLAGLKREVWDAAQAIGIKDRQTLAAHYSEAMSGHDLAEANEEALLIYLGVIRPPAEVTA
jgi:hypothetical protein